MTSGRSRASTSWTLKEAWLLDGWDPSRRGESLRDLIIRAGRLPGGVQKDDLLRTIRRFLGSGLFEEREGRFHPTEALASLRSAIDAEIDSWCADVDEDASGCRCDEAPDFGDLMLKRLRDLPVRESDWGVSDGAYRRARLRAWWSGFWVVAFVRVPLGILAAVILIVGKLFAFLWWLMRRLVTSIGRLFGRGPS